MSHHIITGLLDPEVATALLDYAIANQSRFKEARIGDESVIEHKFRKAGVLDDLGPYRLQIEERVSALVPDFITRLRLTPFHATGFETELAAHQEGAFYKRHLDVFTGAGQAQGAANDRLLSLVYYLHKEPKRFSGGELRLFPQVRPADVSENGAIDIVPQHGLAVAFSSWLPHEVRPVSCPSGRFEDARFAVNCWVLRHRVVTPSP